MSHKIICLLLLCFALVPLYAQDDTPPLILNIDRDLYAWQDGDLRQLTDSGYVSSTMLSPDGRYLAYRRTAQVGLDAVERVGGFSGPMTEDIHLLELTSGEDRVIAGQPDPAYFWDDTEPDNVFARSSPVWSPDGTRIAWTDFLFADQSIQLGVYDLASGVYQSLPIDLPQQMMVPSPINVIWLDTGITLFSREFDPVSSTDIVAIRVYAPDGGLVAMMPVTPLEVPGDLTSANLLVRYDEQDYYAQFDALNDNWILTDLLTGERFSTVTYPVMVSAANPETSLRGVLLPPVAHPTELQGQVNQHFQVTIRTVADETLVDPFDLGGVGTRMASVVFSPDGDQIAYRFYNPETRVLEREVLFTGLDEVIEPVEDGFFSMTWGAMIWTYPPETILTPLDMETMFDCPLALSPRLTVGDTVTVVPGDPNRIRNAPSTDGSVVGQIPAGEIFTVIGGPVCDGEIVWWRVDYAGVVGWTAEGVAAYFLEPVE